MSHIICGLNWTFFLYLSYILFQNLLKKLFDEFENFENFYFNVKLFGKCLHIFFVKLPYLKVLKRIFFDENFIQLSQKLPKFSDPGPARVPDFFSDPGPPGDLKIRKKFKNQKYKLKHSIAIFHDFFSNFIGPLLSWHFPDTHFISVRKKNKSKKKIRKLFSTGWFFGWRRRSQFSDLILYFFF